MLSLLKNTGGSWDLAKDSLHRDLQTIELVLNKKWGSIFGNSGTGASGVFTKGSVLFAGNNGVISQNNSKLFWNNSTYELAIHGTTTTYIPSGSASVKGLQVLRSSVYSTYTGLEKALWVPGGDGAEGYGLTINAFGALFTGAYVVISGDVNPAAGPNLPKDASDSAGLSPHEPTMLSLVTDVVGPAIQVYPKQASSYAFSLLNSTAKHIFNVEADGGLTWGASTRGAEDTNLKRMGVGQLQTDGTIAGPLGLHIKNLSTAAGNTHASIFVENSTSYGQLFKAGTAYTTYKTIAAGDLGFFNITAGNISILNDSGNINFAANGAAAAMLTITSAGAQVAASGVLTAASIITAKLYPSADSTTAISINKADGTTNIVTIDTTNSRVGIGLTNPQSGLHIYNTALNVDSNDSYFGNRFTGGSGAYLDIGTLGTADTWIDARGSGSDVGMSFRIKGTGIFIFRSASAELINITSTGNTGFGVGSSPTAVVHLKAGTATASTAPLKLTSGTSLTTAEAGAIEFTTDDFFATITTGAARKAFVLDNGTRLTSTTIPVATTNGRLIDSTFTIDTTANSLSSSTQPRCVAFNSTTQSINDSAFTVLTFDSEDVDVGGMHSTSSNTSRLTVPTGAGGFYLVTGQVGFAGNAVGARVARIKKNGATDLALTQFATIVSGQLTIINITWAGVLAAADYVELLAWQNSTAALNSGNATREATNALTAVKLW